MEVTTITIKNGKATGFNGRLKVRDYGESGAVGVLPMGNEVTVNYSNGTAKVYDKDRGIFVREI
jgi:hypothetical protein